MPARQDENDDDRGAELLSEQRRAFDRQIQTLENIDDKAARIVRITVLTIGVVVSGASIIERGADPLPPLTLFFGGLGVFGLLVTLLLGLLTFDTTEYKTRLTDGEYASFVKPIPPKGSESRALREKYRNWTRNAREDIQYNNDLFAATQNTLLISTTFLTSGGLWLVIGTNLSLVLSAVVGLLLPIVVGLCIGFVGRFFVWQARTA